MRRWGWPGVILGMLVASFALAWVPVLGDIPYLRMVLFWGAVFGAMAYAAWVRRL